MRIWLYSRVGPSLISALATASSVASAKLLSSIVSVLLGASSGSKGKNRSSSSSSNSSSSSSSSSSRRYRSQSRAARVQRAEAIGRYAVCRGWRVNAPLGTFTALLLSLSICTRRNSLLPLPLLYAATAAAAAAAAASSPALLLTFST